MILRVTVIRIDLVHGSTGHEGLLQIEDCLDAEGGIVLPPGVTLISLIDRNIANVGDAVAYRYLDFARSADGDPVELTWSQLGRRMQAIGARVQEVASRGDRVAILAPQGLDYVAGFFAAIKAGTIAVPLFAPELQGHAERLETALTDARPTAVMTTAAAADPVRSFLASLAFARTIARHHHRRRCQTGPRMRSLPSISTSTTSRTCSTRRARRGRRSASRSPTAQSESTFCR